MWLALLWYSLYFSCLEPNLWFDFFIQIPSPLIFPVLYPSLCTSTLCPFSLSPVLGWSSHLQFQGCFLMSSKGPWSSNDLPSPMSVTSPRLLDPSCEFLISSSLFHFSFLKKQNKRKNPQQTPCYTLVSKKLVAEENRLLLILKFMRMGIEKWLRIVMPDQTAC